MLIERSPADIWITVLGLAFIVRSINNREGEWLKIFWVRAAFLFWFVCLTSSLLSTDPLYSVGEAIVWFRFPLFAMASMFWLGRDKRLLYLMFLSITVGMFIMCFILFAEITLIGQQGERLSWPYGDKVPGNYLAKVGLPAFTVMIALAVSANRGLAALSSVLALVTLFFSILTGERVNFLIRACAGMLAGLVWKPKFKRYFILVAVEVLAVVLLFQAMPETSSRFTSTFISQIPISEKSDYYRAMAPAITGFEQSPLLGIGTGNFRNMCPSLVGDPTSPDCHPHPHNFYVQLLGETGLIGLITGTVFLFSIVLTCLTTSLKNRENVILATAWIVPFGLFWPIATSSDFFGQWNNCFMWSAVGVALAANNLARTKC